MRVCVEWWAGSTGQDTRWNREGFESIDCEVVDSPELADLVFSPIPGAEVERGELFTQLGGYGRGTFLPDSKASRRLFETFENSDYVSVIDPNMSKELWDRGIEEETVMIPNPDPPIFIPDDYSTRFTVFNPMGDSPMKRPEEFREVVRIVGEEESDILFKMVFNRETWNNSLDWLELDNLIPLPRQDYSDMLKLYSESDVIAHLSSAEISPQTVFEAMEAGKPLIAKEMGLIQTIHSDEISEVIEDFGVPSREFHDRWKGEYCGGEGEHFLRAETPDEMSEEIIRLYNNQEERMRLARNALDWITSYSWEPRDKAKKIMEEVS